MPPEDIVVAAAIMITKLELFNTPNNQKPIFI